MKTEVIKVTVGEYRYPITLEYNGNRIFTVFSYQKKLIEEIKVMEGAKYHGYDEENPRKVWSIANSPRNRFQLKILQGDNSPYLRYDAPIRTIERVPRLNLEKRQELTPRDCQFEMTNHIITRKQCIIAAEMGTGKSLSAILAAEYVKKFEGWDDWWIVSNKAGVRAFDRELLIWQANIKPKLKTYEQLVKEMSNWRTGDKAPRGLIFDESSKVKNPSAKRSQAAYQLALGCREDHGDENVYIILMSGSPAPKSPADWFWQTEIACPGFLREGTIEKFKARLSCIIQKQNLITGGVYPHLVTWFDDERKCKVCGELKEHTNHDPMKQLMDTTGEPPHVWQKSVNEVHHLYERMKGLVLVKFKKDCLKDLPEKQYRLIRLQPKQDTLRAAQLIADTSPRAIEALTLLRELSDGFQYKEIKTGEKECSLCRGAKERIQKVEIKDSCEICRGGDASKCFNHNPTYEDRLAPCEHCKGKGTEDILNRITVEVPCPKEDLLIELLDEHEEVGRFVVFAGFQGSIDRCVRIAHEQDWCVIQVDARGWICTDAKGNPITDSTSNKEIDPLDLFQTQKDKYPKVVFIAHAKSGGTSVTLTASPSIFYYSNSFDGEDRIQSEDRIHRMGMDINRGATIIDSIHLPSDEKVLENIRKKRDLQSMSMGELKESLELNESTERIY